MQARADQSVQTQFRTFAIAAAVIIASFLLLQSSTLSSTALEKTRHSLQVVNSFAPSTWRSQPPRITKVTALFGEPNELYEAALRSHNEHNRIHGYDLKVLRERIVGSYWSKPAYLLALVVGELAKPEEARTEWLMWLGPDIVILNPQIPLDLFLPPAECNKVHFIGTHDKEGLNNGAFFLRVHEWSVKMLIDVLALPKFDPSFDLGLEKDMNAMERILRQEAFRNNVVYQLRTWFNAFQLTSRKFEGKEGDLLVHFHGLEGDKWSAMSQFLNAVNLRQNPWEVPLVDTSYEREVDEFWSRIRSANHLLEKAETLTHKTEVKAAADRLNWVLNYETDNETSMLSAMDKMNDALGIVEAQQVT